MKHVGTTSNPKDVATQDQLGGGGSAAAIANVTTPVGTFGQAQFNVVNALSTVANIVTCQLNPNDDYDLDDLDGFEIHAQAQDGSIDFVISADGPIVGDFKISYQLLS